MSAARDRRRRPASSGVPLRLVGFGAVLLVVFAAAALAGRTIDPTSDAGADEAQGHGAADAHGTGGHGAAEAGEVGHGAAAHAVGGLAVSEDGYTLEPLTTHVRRAAPTRFRFRIVDRRGAAVRDGYEVEQDRELHLIVVRRDTAVFQHLHPRRDTDGTWSVDLTLPEAGTYRALADFTIGGRSHTLGTDLFVPGDFQPRPLPAPTVADRVADLDVRLETGAVQAGREARLAFVVDRPGGGPVRLEPYLGAHGHLVALREGDLAYLHVHPSEDGGGPAQEIRFAVEFPTAGRYRLFLQVQVGGRVLTAPYTVEVGR